MTGQETGKEILKDMEYLVKLLHKEWERSGRTKAEVTISLTDAAAVESRMAKAITNKQNQIENEELTFKKSMELSKHNFVLLRLVRKVKKAEEKGNKKGAASEFIVEMDNEEYKIFCEIVKTQEAG
ncbi:MAG: hypothetical protein K2M78_15430 [Lachnospiraceae bacterium]|nr:hypothetical protein [Lachnospiraceae bacterium]